MSGEEKLIRIADTLNETAQASVSMGMPSGCMKIMVENEKFVKDLRKLDTLKGMKVVKKGKKCWINFENKETVK